MHSTAHYGQNETLPFIAEDSENRSLWLYVCADCIVGTDLFEFQIVRRGVAVRLSQCCTRKKYGRGAVITEGNEDVNTVNVSRKEPPDFFWLPCRSNRLF